jgi:hypothetical protein
MTLPTIEIANCSHEAAKYAVLNWHYSKAMPAGKLIKFGVWEDGKFIGAVIYGRGATPNLGKPYGLQQTEICELVRIALDEHKTPVTKIVAETLRRVRLSNPGLRLVVSFADPNQGHTGQIYKAGNWIFTGKSEASKFYKVNGKIMHPRTAYSLGKNSLEWLIKNVDSKAEPVYKLGKLRFLFPLDKAMARKLNKIAIEYPNAVEGLEVSRRDSVSEVLVQFQSTALKANDASR